MPGSCSTRSRFSGLRASRTSRSGSTASEKERLAIDEAVVRERIEARLAARKAKNWAEADRIRDELVAMGITLKDAKNPATGEIETTWEIAR